jgi:hypothetical protein
MAIWTIVGLLSVGLLSPYPQVPISRMHFLMPVVATLAAVAVTQFAAALSSFVAEPARPAVKYSCLALLLIAVLPMNLHRFWTTTPGDIPTTRESVVLRAVLDPVCQEGRASVLVIAPETEPLLKPILASYDYRLREQPLLVTTAVAPKLMGLGGVELSCAVIAGSEVERRTIAGLIATCRPDASVQALADRSGRVEVAVIDFLPDRMPALAEPASPPPSGRC